MNVYHSRPWTEGTESTRTPSPDTFSLLEIYFSPRFSLQSNCGGITGTTRKRPRPPGGGPPRLPHGPCSTGAESRPGRGNTHEGASPASPETERHGDRALTSLYRRLTTTFSPLRTLPPSRPAWQQRRGGFAAGLRFSNQHVSYSPLLRP